MTNDSPAAQQGESAESASVADQPGRSWHSWLAGLLTMVLVIMGVGMLVAQIVSSVSGWPGPGALAVGAHLAGAVVGVACYRVVQRRHGAARVAALWVLPLVIGVLLWLFWLSS